jgi:hypothetical protein
MNQYDPLQFSSTRKDASSFLRTMTPQNSLTPLGWTKKWRFIWCRLYTCDCWPHPLRCGWLAHSSKQICRRSVGSRLNWPKLGTFRFGKECWLSLQNVAFNRRALVWCRQPATCTDQLLYIHTSQRKISFFLFKTKIMCMVVYFMV